VTKKNSNSRPLRVGLISLGCAKNLVDAEIMLGSLLKGGVEITNDAASADAVIVNTCSSLIPRRKKAWTRSSNPSSCATRTSAARP
jgi:tRNA A37 methylthiotransferase MiaB